MSFCADAFAEVAITVALAVAGINSGGNTVPVQVALQVA